MNEIQLTADIAKKMGYDSVESLMEVVKSQDLEKEGLEKVAGEIKGAVEAFTAATKEWTSQKNLEIEETRFEELCKERLVDVAKSLPKNDPQRVALEAEFAAKYSPDLVKLALEGDDYVKAIFAPTSKNNPTYDERSSVRKAHDSVLMLTAYQNGLYPAGGNDDVECNHKKALAAARQLGRLGLDGADKVEKAIEKALDTQTTNEGPEWMPTNLSSSMWDDLYLQLQVPALFRRVQMTSKTFEIPIRLGRSRGYVVDEVIADTAVGASTPYFTNQILSSGPRTGKISMVARKLGTAIFLSDEIEEDALLPVLSMMREEVLYGMADALEDAVINGSTSLSDLDNAGTDTNRLWNNTVDGGDGIRLATGARDARNAWNGLRKDFVTSSGTAVDGGTFSLDVLRNTRKGMGKYGVDPRDLVWLVSPNSHIDIMKLSEVVTLEKFGPQATVLQGEIGRIDGIPLVISPHIYTNLNATAIFDNVTETKTQAILAHRQAYAFGDRRILRVESDRQALAGQRYVLATWRGDFKKMFSAAEQVVGIVRNIAS